MKNRDYMIIPTRGQDKPLAARVTVGDTEGIGFVNGNNILLSFISLSDLKKQATNGPRMRFDETSLPYQNSVR